MDNDAVVKIQQRLAELPTDVQAAIQSSDLHSKIMIIGGKYQLHIDQVGELEDEVMLAMLGFAPLESMAAQVTQTLRLSPDVGEKLAADITTEIFGTIRASMQAFAAKKAQAASPAPVLTAPAAVTGSPATPTAQAKPTPAPVAPDMHQADVVLSQKTVSAPPVAATQPNMPTPAANPIYKTDPYREPV